MANHIVDLRGGRPQRKSSTPARQTSPRKEKRPTPLRVKRRRLRLVVLVLVVIALALATYAVHRVSYLPKFNVTRIDVVGEQNIDPSVITSYVDTQLHDGKNHFFSRSNIFVYPQTVIERGIEASFPRVKSATISRSGLSTALTVTIVERTPYSKWCDGSQTNPGNCFDLDQNGYIFAEDASTTPVAEQYIFTGAITGQPIGQTFVPGHMPGIIALLHIVQQQSSLHPSGVAIESNEDITVHFAEGFDMKASFGEDAAALARNLSLILSSQPLQGKQSEIEYIDLRFGDRVYYKLKGQDEVKQ